MRDQHPTYAGAFQCIGPACEDHCCGDWNIPLDRVTYEAYRAFPEPLAPVVAHFVTISPGAPPEPLFAQIRRHASGLCPFFTADHLCRIQDTYGPTLLSATCSIYPRSLAHVAGRLEASLSLSCPQAARDVLLQPGATKVQAELLTGAFRTDNAFQLPRDVDGHYPLLRGQFLGIIADRTRSIEGRVLAMGALCAGVALPAHFPADANAKLRLEVAFALTDARIAEGASVRFQDTFFTFVEGIAATAEQTDLERFVQAERLFYAPFLATHPYVLENFLTNYVYQHLFPHGRRGSADGLDPFGEFLQLATLFAWLNALLIGIAAHHRESFGADHIVKAVQAFTRATEHYPQVLASVRAEIETRGLNTLEGMAILLGVG